MYCKGVELLAAESIMRGSAVGQQTAANLRRGHARVHRCGASIAAEPRCFADASSVPLPIVKLLRCRHAAAGRVRDRRRRGRRRPPRRRRGTRRGRRTAVSGSSNASPINVSSLARCSGVSTSSILLRASSCSWRIFSCNSCCTSSARFSSFSRCSSVRLSASANSPLVSADGAPLLDRVCTSICLSRSNWCGSSTFFSRPSSSAFISSIRLRISSNRARRSSSLRSRIWLNRSRISSRIWSRVSSAIAVDLLLLFVDELQFLLNFLAHDEAEHPAAAESRRPAESAPARRTARLGDQLPAAQNARRATQHNAITEPKSIDVSSIQPPSDQSSCDVEPVLRASRSQCTRRYST